jgi:hypothetical protein
MDSFESWVQLDREFRFLIGRNIPNEHGQAVSLVLTCPKFRGCPIIAALTGFEAVCGYPAGSFIGKNCRFMNRGLINDPETMSELREMQESPAKAREFIANNPKGKQYFLRNKRPARMSAGMNEGRTPYTPMPPDMTLDNDMDGQGHTFIEFYNHLHVFGFEISRANSAKTPILVGIQFVLASGLNRLKAQQLAREVQELLMNPISNIRDVFLEWSRLSLTVYEEYNEWIEKGTPSRPGVGPFFAQGQNAQDEAPISRDHALTTQMPEYNEPALTAMAAVSPSRQDAFRFMPEKEAKFEHPSSSIFPEIPEGAQEATRPARQTRRKEVQAAMSESAFFDLDPGTDEGKDPSTMVLHKPQQADLGSSLDSSTKSMQSAVSAPRSAQDLLRKIKEVEKLASELATKKKDKQGSDLVKELVTLREAVCDDFAADLNLYIGFYCASKELQEETQSALEA